MIPQNFRGKGGSDDYVGFFHSLLNANIKIARALPEQLRRRTEGSLT